MLTIAMLDKLVTRGLAPPEIFTRYARWLQARGHAETSLGEILIELSQASVEDVKRALAPWAPELDPADITRATGISEETNVPFSVTNTEAFANVLLLRAIRTPGAAVRVETDRALVLRGDSFEEDARYSMPPDRARQICAAVLARWKMMAELDPSRPPPQSGTIWLRSSSSPRSGTGLLQLLSVDIKRTDRGDVALVRRVLPWSGKNVSASDGCGPWRDAMMRGHSSRSTGDTPHAESALREAVALASAMGVDGTLEELDACAELADLLISEAREMDARAVAERAHALAMSYVPSRLVRAVSAFTLAATRVDAPDLRAEGAAAALDTLNDYPVFRHGRVAAFARDAGKPQRAAGLGEAAERAVRKWYGGLTADVFDAWIEAAQADVDLGDPARARERAMQIRELGRVLREPKTEAFALWIEGRAHDCAGDHHSAIERLTSARDSFRGAEKHAATDVEIEADIALALHRAGRSREAHDLVRLLVARSPLSLCAKRSIQEIVPHTGPFR